MRILGYIEHPTLKITVFKMDARLTVKFENAQFEQSYKFRLSEHLNHINDVKHLVDDKFLKGVLENFKAQQHTQVQAMDRFMLNRSDEDEFDVII